MAPVVEAYQALRGVALLTAVTFVAEIGDVRRFESPRQLMAYLGLVPCESSTGERVRRGSITKAGNPTGSPGADRGRLDLSLSGPDEPRAAGAPGGLASDRAGDCLESAGAAVRAVSSADGGRQAPDRGHHRDRAGNGGLPVGDRARDRAALGRIKPNELTVIAEGPISLD